MTMAIGPGSVHRSWLLQLSMLLLPSLMFCSTGASADTFSDFFDVALYNNQDGSNNWSVDWDENRDDDSPTSGDIQIISGELRIKDDRVRITRELDLSSYGFANLSFDYREVGFDDNDDEINVEVRSGGGGGWTRLVRYRGANVNSGSASFDIDASFLATDTEIRFRSGRRTGNNDQFFVDNVIITALQTVAAGDFTDFFNVAAYSNQDGSRNFSTDWAENRDDGSPTAGDVQIISGELRLQNRRVELIRELDLSGFAGATMTFDYREVGFDDRDDVINVEVRSGGAGGWTRLVRYRGANVNSGSASLVIPASLMAVDTEIRFRSGRRTGNNDQFFVDNFNIAVVVTVANLPDHFDITLSSGTFGINCVPHLLKVTVHDSSHALYSSYVGEIQLATTTIAGDWSDGGLGNAGAVVNGVAGDGIATYQFLLADAGEADFYLDYTTGANNIVAIDINDTLDVTIVDDSVETIQFAPSGFTLTQNVLSNPPPNPINDPVTTQIAGTNFNVHLAAYGQTPTDSNCGVIEAYTGSHELHFWLSYDDPGGGTITPTVDGQSAPNVECVPANCGLAANKQNVLFPSGQASVTVKYKDVGSIAVNVKDDDFEAAESHIIPGATGAFVVQPSDIVITTVETGASVANPGTTAAGAGFVAAAEQFHVVVEVRDAEGSLTPNYGNELAAETLRLIASSLVYPVGGNLGSMTNATSFTPTATDGEFENSTASWNNVGTITLTAGIGDGNYLGSGDVIGTPTGNVGRFYPADFALVSSTVTDSCAAGSSSYMSQPAINVSYTLQARSISSSVVTNYDNLDLGFTVALPSYHAEDSNDGTELNGRLSIASGQWDDGLLTFSSTTSSFGRAAAPDGPFNNLQLGLQISDPDGADFSSLDFKPADNNDCVTDGDCTGIEIGGTLNTGFGRMHLKSGFGPELAAIPMSWQTELWDGSSFTLNDNDHCTQLAISDVTFSGATTVVNAASDTITVTIGGASSVFSFADPIGASDCLTATDIIFCDGEAGLQYGAPGAVITYPISVDLTNLPFLQFDWNQDGNHNDTPHPGVNINFQSYRGHDRVIYWQETMQ